MQEIRSYEIQEVRNYKIQEGIEHLKCLAIAKCINSIYERNTDEYTKQPVFL